MTKKIILAVFALIIISLLILNYIWGQPFKQGQLHYINTSEYKITAMTSDDHDRIWTCGRVSRQSDYVIAYKGGEAVAAYELTDVNTGKCNSIVVAPNGNVLVGYDYSLIKIFDGVSWKTLVREVPNITIITTLAVDKSGRVWVGSFNDGISVYDGNSWVLYTQDNSPLKQDGSDVIVFDEEDRAWIGEGDSLYIFDGEKWKIFELSKDSIVLDRNGKSWDGTCCIETIVFDKLGRAWIGDGDSVIVFDNGNLTQYNSGNSGLVSISVRRIAFDDQDRVWVMQGQENVAYQRDMFSVYDGNGWKYYFDDSVQDHAKVIEIDDAGQFWLGYDNELLYMSPNEIEPVSKLTGIIGLFTLSGGVIFIAIALAFVVVSYVIDFSKIIWIGFGVGMFISVFSIQDAFSKYVADPKFYLPEFNFGIASLGFYLIIGGAIGGLIGKAISQPEKLNREKVCIVFGWIAGLFVYICPSAILIFGQ